MFTKLTSNQFILLLFFIIIHLVGCQVLETDQIPVSTPGDSLGTQTQIATLTPSKTEVITQTLTATPTEADSATPESSATPTPTREPGATQISPSDGMVLVYIPAGSFLMGSIDVENGADYDEMPQHLVTLDAYWMDQTVVSNAMYARFLNEIGNQIEERSTWLDAGDEDVLISQQDGIWRPSKGYDDHPAIEVTWFGARAYCQWAGRRLPSEAEWEKGARGQLPGSDDGRVYPWGDEIDCDKAQYANCGGGLLPVSSKLAGASPYGVLGLSGNTWEWVSDWYAEDYYRISRAENPLGPDDGESRVLRGGSWEYDWKHLRAANRRHNGPSVSMHDYSFRCVLDAEYDGGYWLATNINMLWMRVKVRLLKRFSFYGTSISIPDFPKRLKLVLH